MRIHRQSTLHLINRRCYLWPFGSNNYNSLWLKGKKSRFGNLNGRLKRVENIEFYSAITL